MIINHNISSMDGVRNSKINEGNLSSDMERLSSGYRINHAGDDASGLAVSEKMRSQIRGLQQASRNASDGVSFIQTAEGYLQETGDLVQRIRELAVQASNGTYTDEDRMQIQVEVSQLVAEIDRVSTDAQFNGMSMFTGRFARDAGANNVTSSMWFHIGANMDQRIRAYVGTMSATALGLRQFGSGTIVSLSTAESANRTIGVMDAALKIVNKQRADLGGYQNRLQESIKGLDIGAQNLQASESQIRDANMAAEAAKMATHQVLSQAAIAMLAQSNSKTQNVLQLLR